VTANSQSVNGTARSLQLYNIEAASSVSPSIAPATSTGADSKRLVLARLSLRFDGWVEFLETVDQIDYSDFV